ncbi:MAG: radical SAM protein [Chloroflexi bacterium]|nr:radical SAM protein [Chloroflexota bacterium]
MLDQFQKPAAIREVVQKYSDPAAAASAAYQMAENRLLLPEGKAPQILVGTPRTLTVWLHMTERCNLRCIYCYLPSGGDTMTEETGLQAVELAFREAARLGYRTVKFKYAGGEPTLNFSTVIRIAGAAQVLSRETGISLEGVVLSNGFSLPDRMIPWLVQTNTQLMISLDGLGMYQDVQRQRPGGKPTFRYVLRTLDRLDRFGLKPRISITVSRHNLPGLPDVLRFVLERGYPFHLNFFRENPFAQDAASMSIPPEDLIIGMLAGYQVVEQCLPEQPLLGALLDRVRLDIPHNRPCGAAQSYMIVQPGGSVTLCQMSDERVGDLQMRNPMDAIRRRRDGLLNPMVYDRGRCGQCFWQYACAGGCPLLTFRTYGRYDHPSPYCSVYQALIPEVLRLEGKRLLRNEVRSGR